jgi:hypothetical protein
VWGADAADGEDVMTSLRMGDDNLVASTDAEFMNRGWSRTAEDCCAVVVVVVVFPNFEAPLPMVTWIKHCLSK